MITASQTKEMMIWSGAAQSWLNMGASMRKPGEPEALAVDGADQHHPDAEGEPHHEVHVVRGGERLDQLGGQHGEGEDVAERDVDPTAEVCRPDREGDVRRCGVDGQELVALRNIFEARLAEAVRFDEPYGLTEEERADEG
eukprot:gene7861-biopygen6298